MKNTSPESWKDLLDDIKEVFTSVNMNSQVLVITNIVTNLQNNQEMYKNNPDKFFEFIKEQNYMNDISLWLPYLMGSRIGLVDIKLFDINGVEFLENPINVDEKDIFVRFYPNIKKLQQLTQNSNTSENKFRT